MTLGTNPRRLGCVLHESAKNHSRALAVLLLLYAAASLLHFVHNAEFLASYPNLPAAWTRAEVYGAWLVMTAVGLTGWVLLVRGLSRTGLGFLLVYAALGLDSLGHYMVAPLSAHSLAMNASILSEVAAAAILLIYLGRLLSRAILAGPRT
jgi:Kef-type K+ transport system membrane component KefB